MYKYFGYNKRTKEATYECDLVVPNSTENQVIYNDTHLYPCSVLTFEYDHLSEIYLNDSDIFEKRLARPGENFTWNESLKIWSPNVEKFKEEKKQEIDEKCAESIVSGFLCDTDLGSFMYPTKQNDQMNMSSSVLDSLISNDPNWVTYFWCMDLEGHWAFRPHSAQQIQEVGQRMKTHITTQMIRNAQLQNQIDAVEIDDPNALETLEQIIWQE